LLKAPSLAVHLGEAAQGLLVDDWRKQAWLLKNSFALNYPKQKCARMPYKRRSQFSRHYVSPKFWLFGRKLDFFNSHRPFRSLTGLRV
jgi:hypothetical protein